MSKRKAACCTDATSTSNPQPSTSGTQNKSMKCDPSIPSVEAIMEVAMRSDSDDDLDSDCEPDFRLTDPLKLASDESDEELPSCPVQATDTSSASSDVPKPLIWSDNRPAVDHIPFTGSPGLVKSLSSQDPIDYFFLLANDEFFELILRETNAQGLALSNSSSLPFKEINRPDFEVFLGLIYLARHIQVPSYNHYWKKNDLYNFPTFSHAMSRDKFKSIMRALHFTRNLKTGEPKSLDPLYEVRPLFDHFHKAMREAYYPHKNLRLNESMLLWRGRYFPQYVENESHKHGIKYYMLTEPSGIVLRSAIYCGLQDSVGGLDRIENVVGLLLSDFVGRGHSVFFDNCYSSVPLVTDLLDSRIYATGTLKRNKKENPCDVVNKKVAKGEVEARYTPKGVCVMKWHHKRDVIMISSEYTANFIQSKSTSGKKLLKPQAVHEYNNSMGGIDHASRLFTYYPCEGKTVKWYIQVSMHMFNIIMNNAYLLHKQYSATKMRLLKFREAVICKLIYKNKPPLDASLKSTQNIHLPITAARGNDRRKRKRCRICFANGIRKEVYSYCPNCPKHPGLCLDQCFAQFHKYV